MEGGIEGRIKGRVEGTDRGNDRGTDRKRDIGYGARNCRYNRFDAPSHFHRRG
jgi:hypothetical protein